MAASPAHQFGQIIGDLLEAALEPLLQAFAVKNGLYLDKKGPRPARPGVKVTWTDNNENKHDLDFVLERAGTEDKRGDPVAFIETAWRRYTKHSRNKVQEIQGAVTPLREKYQSWGPFLGAILAGKFTEAALDQLRSVGFTVAYFPYDTVLQSFAAVGIDARFEEDTATDAFDAKVKAWEKLSHGRKNRVARRLIELNTGSVNEFFQNLSNAVRRTVAVVRILALHGTSVQLATVREAIAFVVQYEEVSRNGALIGYEVEVTFANADVIKGQFADKAGVTDFLTRFDLN